jgi:hypothetical protein
LFSGHDYVLSTELSKLRGTAGVFTRHLAIRAGPFFETNSLESFPYTVRDTDFYAYDLDQQTNIKNPSTFQAWGMRGTERQRALSLGIFYEDIASKKRWVLNTSDPKLLERVDAVYVTVEPSGGSHRPSTKSLLFAYLRFGANHA